MSDGIFQKGFAIIPLMILLLVIIIGGSAFFFMKNMNKTYTQENVSSQQKEEHGNNNGLWGGSDNQQKTNPYLSVPCVSNPKVQFTHDFTDNDKIKAVEPTIITVGNSRHRAWLDIDTAKMAKLPVYAPVDSELVNGVYKNARGVIDYDLHFQVSCEIWYLINHVTYPVDKIKNAFPKTPQTDTRTNPPFQEPIIVKAGELLGYTTGTSNAHNFDFGVFDLNHNNTGLPGDNGSEYGKEKNFICPFDVLPESIKTKYYRKIITSEKPYTNCKEY